MRLASKLALLCLAAFAALAFTASSANAQIEVLAEDPGGNTHCDVIVECHVEAHGEALTFTTAHLITGAEVTANVCQDEFDAQLEENGEGWITNQRLANPVNGCVRKPCGATSQLSGDGNAWPIHLREANGELSLHVVFCLENADGSGGASNCEVSVHVDDLGSHVYEFTAIDERCAGATLPTGVTAVELDGHWITEEGRLGSVEVIH